MSEIKNSDMPAMPMGKGADGRQWLADDLSNGFTEQCRPAFGLTKREAFFQSNMTAMFSNPMITERHTVEQIRGMVIKNTNWAMDCLNQEQAK